MQHLKYLKVINMVLGGLYMLSFLVLIGMGFLPLLMGASTEEALPAIISMSAGGIFIFIVAVLFFIAGQKVAQGRGRILQTILAVLMIGGFPIGTAIGGYAIWICWMNEETKYMFV